MERVIPVFCASLLLILGVIIGAAINAAFLPFFWQLPTPFDGAMVAVMGATDVAVLGKGIVSIIKLAGL